jgi:hypothetical protein
MAAHRIIEGSAFGPEVVRTATEAFEAAWREIADHIDPGSHEEAREALATAIIAATREDSADAEVLRRAGLRAITRAFPDRISPPMGGKSEGTGSK